MAPGINVTSSTEGNAVRSADGGQHGFLPDFPHIQTGLVAAGAGIRQGAVAPQLGLVDITPLVAHLLDLEMPEASDGVLPMGFVGQKTRGY